MALRSRTSFTRPRSGVCQRQFSWTKNGMPAARQRRPDASASARLGGHRFLADHGHAVLGRQADERAVGLTPVRQSTKSGCSACEDAPRAGRIPPGRRDSAGHRLGLVANRVADGDATDAGQLPPGGELVTGPESGPERGEAEFVHRARRSRQEQVHVIAA